MNRPGLDIVILGLSITSSWGNGHATTYRALVRGLSMRGHRVLFLERDVPWYAAARDLPRPPHGRTSLYKNLAELKQRFSRAVREADLVIVGSYVPNGIAVGEWILRTARGVTAFYDIDTPVTLAMLDNGGAPYLSRELIPRYKLYLSFTGGPVLKRLERRYGSPAARPLYCSVDTDLYKPTGDDKRWDLGYMGTYSADRQPVLDRLLIEPARRCPGARMVVAGPQYPPRIEWPANVARIEHIPPKTHARFYNRQTFTLNVTRTNMVRAGYSPSVRLFEAAACARPIISDRWDGIESFFTIGEEILIAESADEVVEYLTRVKTAERAAIGRRARQRILAQHTAAHRALELESYVLERLKKGRATASEVMSKDEIRNSKTNPKDSKWTMFQTRYPV
ncbi:MAG TPA: glycosyltransferase [Candidatus Eisenbacteria bacterium]|nr:glycosyltransferase [Candidatus Eisenbacteria bacterium]